MNANFDARRDAFIEQTLPVLVGVCVRDGSSLWCATHNAMWRSAATWCDRMVDLDDFADRIIEAWEGQRPSFDPEEPPPVYDTPESAGAKARAAMRVARMLPANEESQA